MICFLRHDEFIVKIYDRGCDIQCVAYKDNEKVNERWKSVYGDKFRQYVKLLIKSTLKELSSKSIDWNELVYV